MALADYRGLAGFRFSSNDPLLPLTLQELFYPIAASRSKGSRIWDVDGNEYVDLTMGFGVHLFGHGAGFIHDAVQAQLAQGMLLGPQSPLAAEVAALTCRLTGMERAAFCNSGTEAVMLALRLARLQTKRSKIVTFNGSYHGWGDGTLVGAGEAASTDGLKKPVPLTPGLLPGVEEHVHVLEYGEAASLEWISRHAGEIAAVLVEPVQSRAAALQPREFLRELRALTGKSGIALIFDEAVTGFRMHPGGMQAVFGIRADLAIYGKALGGGLPLGIVAGSALYMDGVDGGNRIAGQTYASHPATFFAWMFSKHPLAMAAAHAVLQRLMTEGEAIQAGLNRSTTALVERLNRLFDAEQVPMQIEQCGSLFRLNAFQNLDLYCFHLVFYGVYVWEGRNMYWSAAHTDADADAIVEAFAASIHDLRRGGFFPELPPGSPSGKPRLPAKNAESLGVRRYPSRRRTRGSGGQKLPWKAIQLPRKRRCAEQMPGRWSSAFPSLDTTSGITRRKNTACSSKRPALPTKTASRRSGCRSAISIHSGAYHPIPRSWPQPWRAKRSAFICAPAASSLPLHHPVRVAEEWSVVDNLSKGRVGIACASGWHPSDFIFAPEAFGKHRELMYDRIKEIQALWQGKSLRLRDGSQTESDVQLFPMPRQAELPIWITIAGNPDTYRRAGEVGAGVLTNLMGQSIEQLERNIQLYRDLLVRHGHDLNKSRVTVLLHTFLRQDANLAREQARAPFIRYLQSTVGLFEIMAKSLGLPIDVAGLSDQDRDYLLSAAYDRYVETSALIGSVESCAAVVQKLHAVGVTEIGCFIDFGVDADTVLTQLDALNTLRESFCAHVAETEGPKLSISEETVPLTEAQRGIWFECQRDDEAALSYNITMALRLQGALDHGALQQAFRQLIDRHTSLRTVIDANGAFQIVKPELAFDLPVTDFRRVADPEAAVEEWLIANNHKPMDLSQGPLFYANLLRIKDEECLLAITLHHLITDGVSLFRNYSCRNLQPVTAPRARIKLTACLQLCPSAPLSNSSKIIFRVANSWRIRLIGCRSFSAIWPPVPELPGQPQSALRSQPTGRSGSI